MSLKRPAQLTGVAGVHYVAAYLSYHGLHAIPTLPNIAGPDILVSTLDNERLVSLQVKTTAWAMRTQGRGNNKSPHHYEWAIGWSSARQCHPDLFFALVDLRDFGHSDEEERLPHIFFVPSVVIAEYFVGGDPKTWRYARYHPKIETMEEYRNNLGFLISS